MCFSADEIKSFLVEAWSRPLRLACPGFAGAARRAVPRAPRTPAPKWVTAQYFQRWLGEALAARAAWQAQQPGAPRYQFGRRSEPCWSQTITVPQHPGYLRQQPEEVQWFLSITVERLYRMAQTPLEEIGPDLWAQSFLAVCQHLAQLYAALRREYKARRARVIAWDALCRFVEWDAEVECRMPPAPDPTAPASKDAGGTSRPKDAAALPAGVRPQRQPPC